MRLLLLAVVVAQALDALTAAVMPREAEINPIVQSIHGTTGTAVKVFLLVYLFSVEALIHLAPPPRFAIVAAANRGLAQFIAILAIGVGCVGAGSNLSVLAAETPRSVQEPAPIASDAKGIEQGESSPAAPGRIPAPPGSGMVPPMLPVVASFRDVAPRRSLRSRSVPAPVHGRLALPATDTVPRGTP